MADESPDSSGPPGFAFVAALEQLGFEQSAKHNPPGGASILEVTEETVKKIKSLVGKTVTVPQYGGEIKIG
jgi:hypothetical protein